MFSLSVFRCNPPTLVLCRYPCVVLNDMRSLAALLKKEQADKKAADEEAKLGMADMHPFNDVKNYLLNRVLFQHLA